MAAARLIVVSPWPELPWQARACFDLHHPFFLVNTVMLTAPRSPSLSNLSKTGLVSEVPSRGHWAFVSLSMLQRAAICFTLSQWPAERHGSTTKADEINALFLPVRVKEHSSAEPAALHFKIDAQPKQVNGTSLVLTLCLSADFGRYCVIQKMKWFIPVAFMSCAIKQRRCWMSLWRCLALEL